jgi:hypothetical protein
MLCIKYNLSISKSESVISPIGCVIILYSRYVSLLCCVVCVYADPFSNGTTGEMSSLSGACAFCFPSDLGSV